MEKGGMKGEVIEVSRERGWREAGARAGRGDEEGERARAASKKGRRKELSASTKDNIIQLSQEAVVPTATKLRRLKM